MAWQIVTHGHILVNSGCADVPFYLVKPGDLIDLQPVAAEIPVVREELLTRVVTASRLERGEGSAHPSRAAGRGYRGRYPEEPDR
ncbi:MAG: hypothetical protein ACRD2G_11415 [Terriglobia bacterium]